MKHIIVMLALSACAEPGHTEVSPDADASLTCDEPCNDGDPCTDDRCDPDTGTCLALPRNVVDACRTDEHCDDDLACTLDRCVVDDCGLQRCQHVSQDCRTCTVIDGCPKPVAPCTSRVCRRGFCEVEPDSLCDLGCDPDGPPTSEGPCMTLDSLDQEESAWRGELQLDGNPRIAGFTAVVRTGALMLDVLDCTSCPLIPTQFLLFARDFDTSFPYDGEAQVFFDNVSREAVMTLYPTATGFVGSIHAFSIDPSLPDLDPTLPWFDGTIRLERMP